MVRPKTKYHAPPVIRQPLEERGELERLIRSKGARRTLEILEAGCGTKWPLQLDGVAYTLTGIDCDEEALRMRCRDRCDLDQPVQGDLRSVDVAPASFDVIYSAFVLEHVIDAQMVLDRFVRWMRPGGLLILRLPDRSSASGFVTRVTPFWFHVFYYRRIAGFSQAGMPGHAPYPVVYDDIISLKGLRAWAAEQNLRIVFECGLAPKILGGKIISTSAHIGLRILSGCSLGRLSNRYHNFTIALEKL